MGKHSPQKTGKWVEERTVILSHAASAVPNVKRDKESHSIFQSSYLNEDVF